MSMLSLLFFSSALLLEMNDSLKVNISIREEIVEIVIENKGQSTVHIFDSYFDENAYYSRYVHQYDNRNRIKYLSFLPLLPYLSVLRSDRIILGEKKIVTGGNYVYHFAPIVSGAKYILSIPISAFYQDAFVRRICAKSYTKYNHGISYKRIYKKRRAPY